MPFYAYAWIATVLYGLVVILGKLTSKYAIKNPWLFNFIWTLLMLLLTIPFAFFNHAEMPKDWLPIIIAGFFNATWYICYIFSTYNLDVSVLTPMFNFRSVFAVLLSIFLLQETLQPYQFFLIGIIFLAGMFANLDERFRIKSFFTRKIGIALFGMLLLAIYGVTVKKVLVHNGIWEATLAINAATLLFLFPTIPLFVKDLHSITQRNIVPVLFMALAGILGDIAVNFAYKTNVSITTIILAIPISMILTVFLSFFWPKLLEKHTVKIYAIRLFAAAIMIYCSLKLTTGL